MAQTSTQRTTSRRDRLKAEKLAEVRGIIAPPSKHAEIKALVRKAMNEDRINTQQQDRVR